MNEAAVRTIIEYLENSDAPELYWPQQWFEEVCFSRWAAEELINAILDHPMAPAKDTIEERILELQNRKLALLDTISGCEEAGILNMSSEELLSLLKS